MGAAAPSHSTGTADSGMSIPGFVPKPRTRVAVCAFVDPDEGAEPLTATLAMNLSFDQLDAIKALNREPETTYNELFAAVSPHVIAWNAVAFDQVSGDYVPVPPPAEIGADALKTQEPFVTIWLAREIELGYIGGVEREKKVTPSDSTPEPSDGVTTTPPTPIGKRNRARRSASTLTASSAST
jgi:hypothetical protein